MAAGDPIALVNTKIETLNTGTTLTFNAADQDSADATQKFVYTPTGKDSKIVIGVQIADTNGTVSYSISAGAGVFATPTAKTGTIAQATTKTLQLETGKYLTATGTIEVTLTPASGKKLKTDHAAKVYALELL